MGVSATHLDWTMVPYVRKSFAKHLKDAVKYIGFNYFSKEYGDKLIEDMPDEISMITPKLLEEKSCTERLNNRDFSTDAAFELAWPKLSRYAYDMTERELKQAVEGMYHNLNTLQSRSGN